MKISRGLKLRVPNNQHFFSSSSLLASNATPKAFRGLYRQQHKAIDVRKIRRNSAVGKFYEVQKHLHHTGYRDAYILASQDLQAGFRKRSSPP